MANRPSAVEAAPAAAPCLDTELTTAAAAAFMDAGGWSEVGSSEDIEGFVQACVQISGWGSTSVSEGLASGIVARLVDAYGNGGGGSITPAAMGVLVLREMPSQIAESTSMTAGQATELMSTYLRHFVEKRERMAAGGKQAAGGWIRGLPCASSRPS